MKTPRSFVVVAAMTLAACAAETASAPEPAQNGVQLPHAALGAEDDEVAREAVRAYVERGDEAIPELQSCLEDGDARVRHNARTALARITGQWGWQDGAMWKRSVDDAINKTKPLMVLHLFGEFDEEFC